MYQVHFLAAIDIDAAGWTLIDLSNAAVSSVLIQCRTAVDILIGESNNPGEAYWTLKSGTSLSLDLDGVQLGSAFKKLYAKSSAGAVKVEVLYLR